MKVGEKTKGQTPPHGGRWEYDPATDELTCLEEPTAEAPPQEVKEGESDANK